MTGFGSNHRLKRAEQFKRLFAQGARSQMLGFVFYAQANRADCPRLGLAVSRKVAGAVGRNRLKRLIRESFRQHMNTSVDVVVIATPKAATLSNQQIRTTLSAKWEKYNQDYAN